MHVARVDLELEAMTVAAGVVRERGARERGAGEPGGGYDGGVLQ